MTERDEKRREEYLELMQGHLKRIQDNQNIPTYLRSWIPPNTSHVLGNSFIYYIFTKIVSFQ